MRVLVTGSSGLIGSASVKHWDSLGDEVLGLDNDMRAQFFGPSGSTQWNQQRLEQTTQRFRAIAADIRDRSRVFEIFEEFQPELIIHCAAQPSHDLAGTIPLQDFEINAVGTLNLLEATRLHAPAAVFCHMSTNKVYGDAPNELPLVEQTRRWDYARREDYDGIDETCRIDRTMHSLYGASKTASDILAQEYGRYYGLRVGVFRASCLSGPQHSGVELHGFLSHLIHVAVARKTYTIFGYQGKQVRDQLECSDVVRAFEAFADQPRPGEVYNLGGGRKNAASILECIDRIEQISGLKVNWTLRDEPRKGDHICYITNHAKFREHYPQWQVRVSLDDMIQQMIDAEVQKR